MNDETKICHCCGRPMVEAKHGLSRSLVNILIKMYDCKKKHFNPQDDLNITKNQYTNLSKLRYWELAIPVEGEPGKWVVTGKGIRFLMGSLAVPKFVWTFNRKVTDQSENHIYIDDIPKTKVGYKKRDEHARDSRPVQHM